MSNLLDKNDRAVRAYIAAAVAGVSQKIPIYIRNDSQSRDVTSGPGLVDVDSTMGNESPAGSGNYDIQVMVRVKFPAALQPNQSDTDANRVLLGKLQDAVVNQLHQTDNGQDYVATAYGITVAGNLLTSTGTAQQQTDNADMSAYSCLSVVHTTIAGGNGSKANNDLNFYELCNFKVNVAGYGGYWN